MTGGPGAAPDAVGQPTRLAAPDAGPVASLGEDPREHFATANRLYEEGRFAEAAATYEGVVAAGYASPALSSTTGRPAKAGQLRGDRLL
jgi:hypothetical protein